MFATLLNGMGCVGTNANSMMGNFGGNSGGWMGWLGFGLNWIFMAAFWVLIVWAIIAFIKWLSSGACCRHCCNCSCHTKKRDHTDKNHQD